MGKVGMALLNNNENNLPFAKGRKLALSGKVTFDYAKGCGSGDATMEHIVNIYIIIMLTLCLRRRNSWIT